MSFRKTPLIALFIIIIFSNLLYCQSTSSTITSATLEYDGVLGIGWGVFAIIVAIIVGIICCIFGIATIYPATFVIVGFAIPLIVFLIMAFSPLEQPASLNSKDNTATNNYVVVRWLFFTIMLLAFLGMFIPLFILWSNMLIPQRVDSRAQREYYEKYEKLLVEEKQRIEKEREMKHRQSAFADVGGNIAGNAGNGEVLLPIRGNDNVNNNEDPQVNNNNDENDNLNPNRRRRNLIGLRRRKDPASEDKID